MPVAYSSPAFAVLDFKSSFDIQRILAIVKAVVTWGLLFSAIAAIIVVVTVSSVVLAIIPA